MAVHPETMFESPAFDGFAGRTRGQQMLTAFGGIIACLLGYAGATALVYGDLSILADEGVARRIALGGASVACWSYYAVTFIRGRGGPVLNALLFPLLTVGIVPTLSRGVLFGPDVTGLLGGLFSLSLEPLVLVAFAVVPGVGWFVMILTVWSVRIDNDQRRDWERRHLTEPFRDEFLDGADEQ